jgi:lysophospholipase L1-like esterase
MKKNILLLLLALALSFALAEIICRINGKYLSYSERTGAGDYTSPFEGTNRGWTLRYKPYEKRCLVRNEFIDSFTTNEDGLKDINISPRKKGKRILVIGDSFTEGVGAPPDSSYPRILATLIKDSDTQVIDAGLGGSDIFFEYKLLQAIKAKYQPDMVVVTCNGSDILECITRSGFERFRSHDEVVYKEGPWFEPLYAHSLLVRLLVHDVFHYDFNFLKRKDYDHRFLESQVQMCTAIDSFQRYCDTNHIRFAMVFHPFFAEVGHPESYGMQKLIDHCREKNISYADMLPFLKDEGINETNWQSIYWPSDGHFKSKGYELLAQCAYRVIE